MTIIAKKLNEINWKVLFDILIPEFSEKISYQFTPDSLTLEIPAEMGEDVKHRLEQGLRSRAALYEKLPYKVEGIKLELDDDAVQPPPLPTTRDECIEALISIIGEEAAEDCELEAAFPGRSELTNGILTSPLFRKNAQAIKFKKIQQLLAYFINATQEDIRRAWLDPNFHLSQPKDFEAVVTRLEEGQPFDVQGELHNCFGNLEDAQERNKLFINIQQLYRLIFPPVMESEYSVDGSKVLLKFNLEHLYSYLQTLEDDFLLRVTLDENNHPEARPLMLIKELKKEIQPNKHVLIIDISGSMYNDFDKLRSYIIDYMEIIAASDPKASIRLVFFNEKRTVFKSDLIGSDLETLKDKINNISSPHGSTALYSTINAEFKDIKESLNLNKNTLITLFTDGAETVAKLDKRSVDIVFSKDEQARLLVYTFGYGKEHDNKLLCELSEKMYGQYTELKSTNDFSKIAADLEERQVGRKLIDFILELQGANQEIRLPVPLDGQPHALNVRFPFNSDNKLSMEIDGQRRIISIPDIGVVPQRNTTDKLAYILTEATRIASGNLQDYQSFYGDLLKLLAAAKEIRDTSTELPINRRYAKNIINVIQESCELIEQEKQEARFDISIKMLIANKFRSVASGSVKREKISNQPEEIAVNNNNNNNSSYLPRMGKKYP